MKCLQDYVEEPQSKLFDQMGVFFAFSKKQFEEGCAKVGADANNKVTDLGNGSFCLSKNVETLLAEMEKLQKAGIEQDIKENGIEGIIWRELANYETQITMDISNTVVALSEYPISEEQIQAEYTKYMADCRKHNRF